LHVVTNGAQTEHVMRNMFVGGMDLATAVKRAPKVPSIQYGEVDLSIYEPDTNETPRIAAVRDLRPNSPAALALNVVRRDEYGSPYYSTSGVLNIEDLDPNVAYVIHTYKSDAPKGEKLPSFDSKKAIAVPFEAKDAVWAAEILMDWLPEDKRVAVLAHKYDIDTGEVIDSHTVSIHDQAA
jgi:hypothetical protein